MHKVLITGITGFLGANIAENLIRDDISVIGLKRLNSDTWRCQEFESQINWIDIDVNGRWMDQVSVENPDCIIHCAWNGVEAGKRNDWSEQLQNISFLSDLFSIISNIKIRKFIFVGSQAEYGNIEGKISENETPAPLTAYGSVKLACYEILHRYCELNRINWIWLRVFSVFGEKEGSSWLIPSIISRMSNDKEMDFTLAEQKYAYLYIKDFGEIIKKLVVNSVESGIYNVSSDQVQTLRSLITRLRDVINPGFQLNFGALPYREYQSMHLEGDISKLKKQIGQPTFETFEKALQKTIEYYISK